MRPAGFVTTAVVLGAVALVAGPRLLPPSSGSAPPARTDAPQGAEGEQGAVAQVVDGDTIHLEDGRRVRLVQIDTPETHPREACGGAAATAALRSRVARGDVVELEADPRLDDTDQHGRLLRYVHHDGELLNLWLVQAGHAHPYFFRGDRGRHADALLAAARDARSERRGLWGACPGARLDPSRGA